MWACFARWRFPSRGEDMDEKINALFTPLVEALSKVLFWDPFGPHGLNLDIGAQFPFVVLWLIAGATIFTLWMGFINLRGFSHALSLLTGRFTKSESEGELTPFQALCTALSGTVGLGNIAGVAVAITLGGPGATFWMILAGLLGMSSKFVECTLAVKYRRIEGGRVFGGPMHYLSRGLEKRGLGRLGKVLAILFAIMCIGGSVGGGNMFQVNQAFAQMESNFVFMEGNGFWFGLGVAFLVGTIIIGGLTRIAAVVKWVTPYMCGIYVLFALYIIAANYDRVGESLLLIVQSAFQPDAMKGGIIGVLVVGFQRAAFSNEAGIGSAAIAHSAVRTEEPVSEGFVALLEPFIDTVLVCTMTALVLIFTGYAMGGSELEGSALTAAAFSSVIPWANLVLLVCVLLFALSTMLSWSYYGMQCWNYLFGPYGGRPMVELSYKLLFLACIVVGASSQLGPVLDFSDMMILGMSFPNFIGLFLMGGEVRLALQDYLARLKSGAIHPVAA